MSQANLRATQLVVFANIFLIAVKLAVAIITGSIAVVAVLADSIFDFAGSLFAYFGVRKGREPPDTDHHYGHRKYESLSSLAQLLLISVVALLILVEAVRRVIAPVPLKIGYAELAMMAVTLVVDVLIVFYLRNYADAKSTAIQASIGNYTSDILQNSLVVVGLFSAMSGLYIADPIAAVVVSALMLRVVWNVGSNTLGELTDQSPSQSRLDKYASAVLSVQGVRSFHKLRARSVGGEVKVDLHIQLDRQMPLSRSHAVSEKVKQLLLKKFPEVKEVLIHTEPATKRFMRGPKFGS
ncbi:MAG: cation diffusion facilitator family transporter [Candidatus Micrarchaeota archaeon]|nr:cation diffusion facilitator family transporter [Candidatus Micrarchaeota archaeon]